MTRAAGGPGDAGRLARTERVPQRPGRLALSRAVLRGWSVHGVTGLAAETAFFVSLALFPTVLTLVGVLRALRPALGGDAAAAVSDDLAGLLRVVLTARGSIAAQSADRLLRTATGGLLGLGTAVSFFVLARGLRSVQRGLRVVAGGQRRSPRQEWTRAVLLAAGLLILVSLLLAAFTIGPLLGHGGRAGPDGAIGLIPQVWTWLRWPVSALALLAVAMLLLVQETPRGDARWTARLPGAALTLVGWIVVTALLPVYVTVVGRVSPTLGSLGGGLIVLSWVYLLSLSLFLGAEVNAVRLGPPVPTADDTRPEPSGPAPPAGSG